MNMNEYNKKVRAAISRDRAVNMVQDVSNLGQEDVRTVIDAGGKKIALRLYGR